MRNKVFAYEQVRFIARSVLEKYFNKFPHGGKIIQNESLKLFKERMLGIVNMLCGNSK